MMTDQELAQTMKIAAESVRDNIALYMLMKMAAQRIEELSNG